MSNFVYNVIKMAGHVEIIPHCNVNLSLAQEVERPGAEIDNLLLSEIECILFARFRVAIMHVHASIDSVSCLRQRTSEQASEGLRHL